MRPMRAATFPGLSESLFSDELVGRRGVQSSNLDCGVESAVDGSVARLVVKPSSEFLYGSEPPGVFLEPRPVPSPRAVDGQVFADASYEVPSGSGGAPGGRRGGGKRGVVTDFSRQSRRRLQTLFCSVPRTGYEPWRMLFITLTYHNVWGARSKDWKNDLNAFKERLYRKWGTFPGVWRLEFQKRGAPHFHLLLFPPVGALEATTAIKDKDQPWTDFKADVLFSWHDLVAPGDVYHWLHGVKMTQGTSWRGAMYYLSKYVSKVEENLAPATAPPGRVWGCWHKSMFGIVWRRWNLEYMQYVKLRRVFRRKCRYRRGRGEETGMTCFVDWSAFLRLGEYLGLSPPVS